MSTIRVIKARAIGRFRNPENNRPTRLYVGTDSKTGRGVRFYFSMGGVRHFIENGHFRAWKGVKE